LSCVASLEEISYIEDGNKNDHHDENHCHIPDNISVKENKRIAANEENHEDCFDKCSDTLLNVFDNTQTEQADLTTVVEKFDSPQGYLLI